MEMQKFSMPELRTEVEIPGRGKVTYSSPEGEIEYSPYMTKTGNNYYDSKAEIPEGYRMSTAAEELAIQLALEREGKDPRKSEVFNDLFARGPDKIYMWQWTETGLRMPKGRDPKSYETDPQGRKYWVRMLLIGDEEQGEVMVPEGGGRIVPYTEDLSDVWDEVSGLPRVTAESGNEYDNHTTHFWFNPNMEEGAVGRWGIWLHDGGREGCLRVDAHYGRSGVDSRGGFRLVRGPLGTLQKTEKTE